MRLRLKINKLPVYIILPTRLALNIFAKACIGGSAANGYKSGAERRPLTPEEKKKIKKTVSGLSRFHKKWTLIDIVDANGRNTVRIDVGM